MGIANAPLDHIALAFLQFRAQQRFQIPEIGLPFLHRLLGQPRTLRGDGRHMQRFALLPDRGFFENRCRRAHRATSAVSSRS
jgi:hypothetical protein